MSSGPAPGGFRREEPNIFENVAAAPPAAPRARGVSTARTVLTLLALLARAEHGLRADEIAEALGKSTSTAYNLLDTLCQEGFAVHVKGGAYHLSADAAGLVPPERAPDVPADLAGLLDQLFLRTHKRVYLAAARSGQVVIPLALGRQGMPRIPGLGARIGENAHALALGKVALSLLDGRALARYLSRPLRTFTPLTITDPGALAEQLDEIRAGGVAYDCEEFREDFSCLAVPVRNTRGRAVAALGISMSARAFELEREPLSEALRDVAEQAAALLQGAPVPAISENAAVLEPPVRPSLRSGQPAVPVSTGEEATP